MALTTAEIIAKARAILGNEITNSQGEAFVPDEAIETELAPTIREVNEKFGSATGVKEIFLTVVADQQDYAISAIAGDIKNISEVLRSNAHYPSGMILTGDGATDLPFNTVGAPNNAPIPSGLQRDVFDKIIQQERYRRAEDYSWETFGDTLRLFPPPTLSSEAICIRYLSTGSDITTIPPRCETLMVYAACTAIIDGELNRLNRGRLNSRAFGEADIVRVRLLQDQHKKYTGKYDKEFTQLK